MLIAQQNIEELAPERSVKLSLVECENINMESHLCHCLKKYIVQTIVFVKMQFASILMFFRPPQLMKC